MAQKFVTPVTIRNLASASSDGLAVSVDGDTNDRIKFEAGGRVVWGSGASAGDVNLYRADIGALKTDHTFEAESGIITLTTTGAPVASVADGALAVDTTNDDLYFRSNGAWKKVDNVAAVSDTAPSNPQEGDIWFESDTGDFFIYYSSAWVDIGGSSVANIAVTTTPPSSPVNGDLWFDTDTAKTYVYYNDGTSGQWVEIGAASAAASGADGAIQFATSGTFNSASALVWDNANSELEVTGTVIADGLTVDTDTLHVDFTNNRVGIGDTTPSYTLDVNGDINTTGAIRFQGTVGYTYVQTVYFTSNGTFTKATYPWLRAVKLTVTGGGGGGSSSPTSNVSSGAGGGGGGTAQAFVLASSLSASETVTIGAGGTGGAAGGNDGGAGGTSSFGSHAVATGGAGGEFPAGGNNPGGIGGNGTAGDLLFAGDGGDAGSLNDAVGGSGGGSFFGGGAQGIERSSGTGSVTGRNAQNYGGGGGGGVRRDADAAGGDGSNGIVIVELFA